MSISRREFINYLAWGVAVSVSGNVSGADGQTMYGLIGKIEAVEGQREALSSVLTKGIAGLPGCLSYIVAHDRENNDALWITEVWDSARSHKASLALPTVQQAISEGRPLIERFIERYETTPVGGHGLKG